MSKPGMTTPVIALMIGRIAPSAPDASGAPRNWRFESASVSSIIVPIMTTKMARPRAKAIAERFHVPPAAVAEFCRKHHIRRLSLFGSVLTDDFRPDSDIDVLVEFEAGHVPGFAIVDMEDELSRLVGRKVDLRTPRDLSRYFRERVLREARLQYGKSSE